MLNIGQNRTSIIENLEIKGEQRIGSNQISLDSDFVTMFLFVTILVKLLRANWSRDTFQPMRRRGCVYQQTNQNIALVIKDFQNSGRSRTELKMSLRYSSRFHI